MNELITVFITGLISTFALGFQSRNVNTGQYGLAAGGSFFIGVTNALLWSHITSPTAGPLAGIVYGVSGAIGITASMYVHKRYVDDKTRAGI